MYFFYLKVVTYPMMLGHKVIGHQEAGMARHIEPTQRHPEDDKERSKRDQTPFPS
jgi:hypothetical protein